MHRRNGAVVAVLFAILAGGCGKPAGEVGAGPSASANATDSGLVECGKWTILDTRTDLTDRARAKQNVEDALIRYEDVGCLVGLWSYNGPAILSAVEGARKQGKTKIVCFDEEEDTLRGVESGSIHATVVQQPYEFGLQSVRILAALAKRDRSVLPEGGVLDIPVQIVRKDNVDAFRQTLAERLAAGSREAGRSPDGAPRIAFVTNNVSDFWKIARAGVNKACAELGVVCEFHMPPEGTPADQQRIVEALITKKISGMAISPNDAQNQIDMLNQAAAAMNVITQDSDAPASKRLCYVGTNNYKAGREAGKLIKEVLPDGGKLVLFVGRLDAQNARDRRQGIIDELSGK